MSQGGGGTAAKGGTARLLCAAGVRRYHINDLSCFAGAPRTLRVQLPLGIAHDARQRLGGRWMKLVCWDFFLSFPFRVYLFISFGLGA